MTIIPPNTWRMIGRWGDDVPESYIPLAPGPRSRAILQRTIDGPTEEERMASQQATEKREADRYVQMRLHKLRHMTLVRLHPDGVVANLLVQHQPREVDRLGSSWLECHGCPAYQDDHPYQGLTEVHHEWPCPTWQTISDSTS
jgi:hypothetical protein